VKFASEGYVPASIPALAGIVAWLAVGYWLAVPLLVFAVLVLLFFRDPQRTPLGGPSSIISPADGRIVDISDGMGHALAPGATKRVSIFMSPLDVHINRMPATASIEHVSYKPGKFRAAYGSQASDTNESNALLLQTPAGWQMVVVQIAGWLARRIVCDVVEGDQRARCERFGLIMFGSRVDMHMPADVHVLVAVGERVAAGRTVIAEPPAGEVGSGAPGRR